MLLTILIILVCLALIMWAIEQIPMTPPLNWIIRVLVILIAVVLILQKTGLA